MIELAQPAELVGTFVVEIGERQRTPFLVFYSDERDYEVRLDLNTHWRVRFADAEACVFLGDDYHWRTRLSGCDRRNSSHHLEILTRLNGMMVKEARRDTDLALRVGFSDQLSARTNLTVSGEWTRCTVETPWHLRRCRDASVEITWRHWLDTRAAHRTTRGRHAAR